MNGRSVEPPVRHLFDFDGALKRLGNNRSLYARLALQFSKDQGEVLERLRCNLDQGDLDSARRELHTLKGVAAALGAASLSRAAATAETTLKNNAAPGEVNTVLRELERLLIEVCRVLPEVAQELESMSQRNQGEGGSMVDHETFISRLLELEPLLADGNMRAMELYQDIRTESGSAFLEQLKFLDEAMQRLDFPAAVKLCRKLRETPA